MAVVVDTGFAWALLYDRDRHHAAARAFLPRLLSGRHGAALTNDYVYAEATTLALKAGPRHVATMDALFHGPDAPFRVARVDARAFERARERLLAEADRGLTLADWSLVVLAERHDAEAIVTFDGAVGRAYGKALP